MSGGWNPSVHLTCHLGARPVWREDIAGFVPKDGAVPGLSVAGAARGVFDTAGCLQSGAEAGLDAARALGFKAVMPDLPEAERAAYRLRRLWAVPGRGRA